MSEPVPSDAAESVDAGSADNEDGVEGSMLNAVSSESSVDDACELKSVSISDSLSSLELNESRELTELAAESFVLLVKDSPA